VYIDRQDSRPTDPLLSYTCTGEGDHIFRERSSAITDNKTLSDSDFSKDEFIPDINNLFGEISIGDNIDAYDDVVVVTA
jgi:hypothetical protein